MRNFYSILLSHLSKDISLALATIVETRGSTPQVQGASAIFSTDGLIYGTLGGGILEAEAGRMAREAIQHKTSRISEFEMNSNISDESAAICGGKVVILMDASPGKHNDIFQEAEKSLGKQQPGVLMAFIERYPDGKVEIKRFWNETGDMGSLDIKSEVSGFKNDARRTLEKHKPSYLIIENITKVQDVPEKLLFLEPLFPFPSLVIAGAGHVGQAVARLGGQLEFEVTIIDDRPEYCNRDRFPDADHLIVKNIGQTIEEMNIVPSHYIVIVTRGHHDDAEALKQCIKSKAAYIGMMGSRRKTRLMRQKFLEEGWATPALFDRIHTPIGIDILSETVQEIALSICAQLVLVRNQGKKHKSKPVINAIILAAGESSRMGKPKLLLPYGDRTIIETVIREAAGSQVSDIVVVIGSDKERIREHIRDYPVIITENPDYQKGMLSSIQCGIRALPHITDAVMVILGDQPMIPGTVINELIDAFSNTEKGIVVAAHNGKRGHPILLDMKYRKDIEELKKDNSLHNITRKYAGDMLEVEAGTQDILMDIDTPDDYNNELKYRRLS